MLEEIVDNDSQSSASTSSSSILDISAFRPMSVAQIEETPRARPVANALGFPTEQRRDTGPLATSTVSRHAMSPAETESPRSFSPIVFDETASSSSAGNVSLVSYFRLP